MLDWQRNLAHSGEGGAQALAADPVTHAAADEEREQSSLHAKDNNGIPAWEREPQPTTDFDSLLPKGDAPSPPPVKSPGPEPATRRASESAWALNGGKQPSRHGATVSNDAMPSDGEEDDARDADSSSTMWSTATLAGVSLGSMAVGAIVIYVVINLQSKALPTDSGDTRQPPADASATSTASLGSVSSGERPVDAADVPRDKPVREAGAHDPEPSVDGTATDPRATAKLSSPSQGSKSVVNIVDGSGQSRLSTRPASQAAAREAEPPGRAAGQAGASALADAGNGHAKHAG